MQATGLRIESSCSTSCRRNTTVVNRRDVLHRSWAGSFLFLAADFSAAAAAAPPVHARVETPSNEADAPTSPYIQELLKRSRENKERHDKERLQAYYKKNFKDYFEFDGGSSKAAQARGIKPETQAAIQRWLEDNQ